MQIQNTMINLSHQVEASQDYQRKMKILKIQRGCSKRNMKETCRCSRWMMMKRKKKVPITIKMMMMMMMKKRTEGVQGMKLESKKTRLMKMRMKRIEKCLSSLWNRDNVKISHLPKQNRMLCLSQILITLMESLKVSLESGICMQLNNKTLIRIRTYLIWRA